MATLHNICGAFAGVEHTPRWTAAAAAVALALPLSGCKCKFNAKNIKVNAIKRATKRGKLQQLLPLRLLQQVVATGSKWQRSNDII